MSARLSKSRFQKGLQCEKALWLAIHEPGSADPVTESTQWVFDQGTAVGRIAHGLFPGGIEVTENHLQTSAAIETTARLLSEGATVLYEPAFTFDGVLVRVDILVAVDGGTAFDLYEVKSTTKVKPEHITDAAVQTYVVEGAGVPVRRTHVVHLDTTYSYEGGAYDASRLFAVVDVTRQAREFIPLVHDTLEQFRQMLAGPEPAVRIGQQCGNPHVCEFSTRCHGFLPNEHPITDLPRICDETLHALIDDGILCVRDVPDDSPWLTPLQRRFVRVAKSGQPYVDAAGLTRELDRLEYPVRHLDFETFRAALPLWPGSRPYELVPFQYSIHVEHADGTVEHLGYLHGAASDPRPALADRLLRDLGGEGSITHYTSYERQALDALAAHLPVCAARIARVKRRLFDLEALVRSCTVHPHSGGRTSIKRVLPAWCSDVSYAGLDIRDGQTASVRYLRLLTEDLGSAERAKVLEDLDAYCGTDTLAMVHLLEALRTAARSSNEPVVTREGPATPDL